MHKIRIESHIAYIACIHVKFYHYIHVSIHDMIDFFLDYNVCACFKISFILYPFTKSESKEDYRISVIVNYWEDANLKFDSSNFLLDSQISQTSGNPTSP